jgi:hypothetical protein
MSEWISVGESLPEIDKNCWRTDKAHPVWCSDIGLTYAYFTVDGWRETHKFGNARGDHSHEADDIMDLVTHYQPLPSPPVKQEERA